MSIPPRRSGIPSTMERAIKIAHRSTMRTHKTGAIIVDRNDNVLSNGWSHTPSIRLFSTRSLHAEAHALLRARHLNLVGATIYIATISAKSGNTVVSRPCLQCAIALESKGIRACYYTTYGEEGYIDLTNGIELYGFKTYDRNETGA